MMTTRHWLISGLLILTLAACTPPPHQQLDAAEYLVPRAYAMGASHYAPAEFEAAQNALNDAHDAMKLNDFRDAEESLEFALNHAKRAIELTNQAKARLALEEKLRKDAERKRAEAAARAREEAELDMLRESVKRIPAPPKPETETNPVPVNDYKVGEGENLWTIAAQPTVYADGLLWPLLYQANRDQIKDPRQIFPGQTLSIRRDLTAEEKDAARARAKESGIFPIPSP